MSTATKLREEGKREGELKGKKEEKIETAKKMLTKGYSIQVIEEITELSREEINTLTNNR